MGLFHVVGHADVGLGESISDRAKIGRHG